MTIKRPPAALEAEVHATYHAAKRPHQNTSSLFENLPTEILQQIFFAGLNGNLLKASPRIAVKLSGSQNIYRTSFFIAFYHHQILELRKEFRFEYLVPYIEVPVPAWELRSIVKAVLDSQWCKWSWVKRLLFGLLEVATVRFDRDYASRPRSCAGDVTDILGEGSDDSKVQKTALNLQRMADNFRRGTGKLGAENELQMNIFNMAIISRPKGSWSSDLDEEGYVWEIKEHWRLQLCPFGDIPLESAKLDVAYKNDTPFRDLVHRSFGICGISVRQNALGMWQRLEGRLYDAIATGDVVKLRHLLQLDYFLRPEDLPYHIPAKLYLAAALSDCDRLQSGEGGVTQMPLLHVLFSIDPYALPRLPAPGIHRWVLLAQDRVRAYAADRHAARVDLKWDLKDDILSGQAKREARNAFREVDYIQKMDIEVLRFLATGVHEIASKRHLISPDFTPPLLWLPNEPVDDKEIIAEDDEELAVVKFLTDYELLGLVGRIVLPGQAER